MMVFILSVLKFANPAISLLTALALNAAVMWNSELRLQQSIVRNQKQYGKAKAPSLMKVLDFLLIEYVFFQGFSHTAILGIAGNIIAYFFYFRDGVTHCNRNSCCKKHIRVVSAVTHSNAVFWRNA